MKIKRFIKLLLLCIFSLALLTACNTSKSYTFQTDSGEKIKVTLDTTDGYDLIQKDGTVTVQKDKEDILMGMLLKPEGYEEYVTAIHSSDGINIIEAEPEDSPLFYLYQFEGEAGMETTFLFNIEGAKTSALFVSLFSMDQAKAAYERLTFELIE